MNKAGDSKCSALAMSLSGSEDKILENLLGGFDQLNLDQEIKIFTGMISSQKMPPNRRALTKKEVQKARQVLDRLESATQL